ncbi:MAG: formyltransferase family protein [Candidatus Woesebacteria bacterium]
MSYSIVIAGSTERTKLCATALVHDPRFSLQAILTPSPKSIGRKQIVSKNAFHEWSEENQIPVHLVEKKIDEKIRTDLETIHPKPDFLLVVDFGYIVPKWLLAWPSIAPVNIHPSALPKYRGSSPGQFVLMAGEKESAVSFIVMDEKLDHGPLITALPFTIKEDWTASDYYFKAFSLAQEKIGDILFEFAKHQESLPQPDESPTPVAHMLTREDGFVPFETLLLSINTGKDAEKLYNRWRGLTPWPGIWTTVHIAGQEKRMKVLKTHIDGEKFVLDEVQVEGKNPTHFTLVQEQLDD